jgi:hypothetical protein
MLAAAKALPALPASAAPGMPDEQPTAMPVAEVHVSAAGDA